MLLKYFFFGQQKGSGTTSNMVAVATRLSVKYKKKIILLQLQANTQSFELAFYRNWENQRLQERCQYFLDEGFDLLLQKQEVESKEVERSLRELIPEKLYYFPMGERELPFLELVQYESILCRIVEELEQLADYVFIDCGAVEIRMLNFMKNRKDVYVINFSQKEEAFEAFFLEQYDTTSRFFYLVGNYHANSVCNKKNLTRIYRIPNGKVGVVPYNPQFQHVCQRGKLWHYLSATGTFGEQERDRIFREEMDEILEAILQEAEDEE